MFWRLEVSPRRFAVVGAWAFLVACADTAARAFAS